MKYLGVDYGTKKIGLAKSDIGNSFAFPLVILPNDGNSLYIEELLKICQKEGVTDIVIGQSLNLEGKENRLEKDIKAFIEKLPKEYVIHRFDERMTTAGVQSMMRFSFQKDTNTKNFAKNAKAVREHSKDDDAKVAAYMLQGFLDKNARV
jgi:putative Holliday junction resolvase